jgi:hypothetical protein
MRKAIEVIVVNEESHPVPDLPVKLYLDPAQILRAKTDSNGWARFDGLLPGGSYLLSLTSLDRDVWEQIRVEALSAEKSLSHGDAPWQPTHQRTKPKWRTHIVDQGDCVNSVARQYGFLPDSLWNLPSNSKLRERRKRRTVLYPGDLVRIPPKRLRWDSALAGNLYRLRRKGAPDRLKLRFLNCDQEPRVDIPYTLTIQIFSGDQLKAVHGTLDGDGYLTQPIPPDADVGELVLGTGPDRETYILEIGWLDPSDTFSGVQDRLSNLGYYFCCEHDTPTHQVTQEAVALWQLERDLNATGRVQEVEGDLEGDHLS